MKKKELNISLKDWDHTCTDGCCTTWGCDISINGEELDSTQMVYGDGLEQGLKIVLEALGYKVTINYE